MRSDYISKFDEELIDDVNFLYNHRISFSKLKEMYILYNILMDAKSATSTSFHQRNYHGTLHSHLRSNFRPKNVVGNNSNDGNVDVGINPKHRFRQFEHKLHDDKYESVKPLKRKTKGFRLNEKIYHNEKIYRQMKNGRLIN